MQEEHRNITPCSSAGILHAPCDTHLKIHTDITYLSHLLLQIYVFVLERFSKKLRMGNCAPLVLHVPNLFLKMTVIIMSRISPPFMEPKGSSPFSQLYHLIPVLSHMNPVQAYTSQY